MELCCRRIRRGIVTFQTVGAQQRRFTQPGHDRGWECHGRGESEECHHTLFLLGCDWLGRRIHGANNNNNEVDDELIYIYIPVHVSSIEFGRSIDRWPPKIFFVGRKKGVDPKSRRTVIRSARVRAYVLRTSPLVFATSGHRNDNTVRCNKRSRTIAPRVVIFQCYH